MNGLPLKWLFIACWRLGMIRRNRALLCRCEQRAIAVASAFAARLIIALVLGAR
jgi:hypothetical protein